MRLLVSVRSAAEAAEAAAGGADVVDAKEPAAGALGRVAPEILAAIVERAPARVPVSAALGDVTSEREILDAFNETGRTPRPLSFVKLGFRGVDHPGQVHRLLVVATAAAAAAPGHPRVVAVAYADTGSGAPEPERVLEAAAAARVAGILLDTADKRGGSLLAHRSPAWLRAWVARAQSAGCFTALAGSLGAADLVTIRELGADLIGVRGAACEGGRNGRVSAERIRRMLAELDPEGVAVNS